MRMPHVLDLGLAYGLFYAAVLAGSLSIYFATGFVLDRINRRHPERRIQDRSGAHRIRAEIRSSVGALSISSALFAGGLFAQWAGFTPFAPLPLSWWSIPLAFLVLLVAYDAWFYAAHRLLHTKALYRFHVPHHRSVAPTPWSNDSSTAVDTLITHAFFLLIVFVVPVPPLVLIAHRVFDQVSGMIGHSGYEHFASPSTRWPSLMISTLFHDQHHSSFHYNYGNVFSFWDRVFGTIHPGYDPGVKALEARIASADGAPVAEPAASRPGGGR